MPQIGDKGPDRRAPVSVLDDVRERRKGPRTASAAKPSDSHSHAVDEDRTAYALDLTKSAVVPDQEELSQPSADDVIAQHSAAAAEPVHPTRDHHAQPPLHRDDELGAPAPTLAADQAGSDTAPADEILVALEAHHRREQPSTRGAVPRGSADLQPQLKPCQPSPTISQTRSRDRRTSHRLLGAVAVLAAAAAIPVIALAAGGTNPTRKPLHRSQPRTAAVIRASEPQFLPARRPTPVRSHRRPVPRPASHRSTARAASHRATSQTVVTGVGNSPPASSHPSPVSPSYTAPSPSAPISSPPAASASSAASDRGSGSGTTHPYGLGGTVAPGHSPNA